MNFIERFVQIFLDGYDDPVGEIDKRIALWGLTDEEFTRNLKRARAIIIERRLA